MDSLNLPYPDKWDIIPVHTSDRGTFKDCRRKWEWSSPARSNLIKRTKIHGITLPLWYGTGIHWCLEQYYNPVLSQDPVVSWEAWFSIQWNGGLVAEEQLKEYADRDPVRQPNGTYVVKGLKDILPDPDPEVFEEHRILGIEMMKYYKDYSAKYDNFRVVATEHEFSIPILDPDGQPLYLIDKRHMPEDWEPDFETENMYGPLMMDWKKGTVAKQVHARGRQDIIIQDNESGRYGIKDYKTAGRIDEDYFRHLDLDEQCTTYLWAAEREAQMYDVEWDSVDFIIYEALRKAYPSPPTMTTKGLPSLDRQKESTTAELFAQCIKENNLSVWYESNEKAQSYYDYLVSMGDDLFIQRGAPGMPYVYRNATQKRSAGERLYHEALDMLQDPRIYPNPGKRYSCLNCIFRAPCLGVEAGYDWEEMLKDGFMENYDR